MTGLRLRHGAGPVASAVAADLAVRLATVLGVPVTPARAGDGPSAPGDWCLVPGDEVVGPSGPAPEALVIPARRDACWTLGDPAGRVLEDLPPGGGVVVPNALGAGLLAAARPDLRPIRAGAFPVPEETPVLVPGPVPGRGRATALPVTRFVPPPGSGLWGLRPADGGPVPDAVRAALDDAPSRTAALGERAFVEGLGPIPDAGDLAVHVRPGPLPILLHLHARRFPPGAEPRTLDADLPQEHVRQFAAGFGRHWASTAPADEVRTKHEESA